MSNALIFRPEDGEKDLMYAVVVVGSEGKEGYIIMTALDILFTIKGWEFVGVTHVFVEPIRWPINSTMPEARELARQQRNTNIPTRAKKSSYGQKRTIS